MNSETRLTELLRDAADVYTPTDGLGDIETKVAGRRRARRVRRVALPVAAAVIAAIAVPLALRGGKHHSQRIIGVPAPTTAVPSPEPTTTQAPATSARAAQAPAEAGAPGGPVPRGIRLLDFTFVTPDQGWLLADATCSSPPCTSVLRTTDGGTSWVGVPAPRVGTSYPCAKPCGEHPWVDSLRFADRTNGWAYHTSLYATHDGARSWHPVSAPDVMALAAARGTVVAIVAAPCDSGACNLGAIRSAVGSDEFQQLPFPSVPSGTFDGFERHGSALWVLLGGSQQNRVLRSLDDGNHWADLSVRCSPGEEAIYLSAASETTLWAICQSAAGGSGQIGSHRGVTVSRDGGMTWGDERDIPTGDRADRGPLGITAASPDRLFLERNSHQIYATDDGAATWRSSLEVPGDNPVEGGLLRIGAQDETHVRVLQFAQTYWWTDDGGRRWQSHRFG